MAAYCDWHRKKLKDIEEYEQEQCWKKRWDCSNCAFLTEKECEEEDE